MRTQRKDAVSSLYINLTSRRNEQWMTKNSMSVGNAATTGLIFASRATNLTGLLVLIVDTVFRRIKKVVNQV